MIKLKSDREIKVIRENCRILVDILLELERQVKEGLSTKQLDRLAEQLMGEAGAEPAFKGYHGFPASICTSINEEVVHGIPSETRVLQEGDLLSIDIGIKRAGFYADKAVTVMVGDVGEEARKLVSVTRSALLKGIEAARVRNRVSDISHAIGSYVESEGLFVVKRFVGHGIGREMHEDPQIPNSGPPGQGARLQPGMVMAIEPMVKGDQEEVKLRDDGWTAVTNTGSLAAHFEEMVLVTKEGPQILT